MRRTATFRSDKLSSIDDTRLSDRVCHGSFEWGIRTAHVASATEVCSNHPVQRFGAKSAPLCFGWGMSMAWHGMEGLCSDSSSAWARMRCVVYDHHPTQNASAHCTARDCVGHSSGMPYTAWLLCCAQSGYAMLGTRFLCRAEALEWGVWDSRVAALWHIVASTGSAPTVQAPSLCHEIGSLGAVWIAPS